MGKNLIVPNVIEDILMLTEKRSRIQVGGVNENDVFELLYQLSQLTEDKTSFKKEDLQRAKVLFEECRDYSVSALQKMGYAPRTPGIKSEVKGQTSKIPTLLKVLWWYMSFQAQKIELNFGERVLEGKRGMAIGDQTILNFLNDAIEKVLGFKLAKKTFTEFAVSPSRYLGAVTYNQIKLPYTYAGAKTDEWGYPINYLSRIVKEYDIFLDLFGGGGYATLAVNPLTNVEYYINEITFLNTVYYQVLTDESLYLQFKDLLGVLVKAVEGDPDAIQYFVNKGINGLSTDDSVQNMREIYSYYMDLIEVENWEKFGVLLQHSLRINDDDFDFMNTYRRTAAGECKRPFTDYVFKMSDSELIDAALAFVISFTFTTGASSRGASSIKPKKIETLLSMLKNNCFDVAHDRFRNMRGIGNSDSITPADEFIIEYCCGQKKTLLNKRETFKKCLIYSDSPYLATQGYEGGDINSDSMHELIDKLVGVSSQDNHFIFSCRGTCTTTSDTKHAAKAGAIAVSELEEILSKGRGITEEELRKCADIYITDVGSSSGLKKKSGRNVLQSYQNAAVGNKALYEDLFGYFDKLGKFYVLVSIPRSEMIDAWRKVNKDQFEVMYDEFSENEKYDELREEAEASDYERENAILSKIDAEVMAETLKEIEYVLSHNYQSRDDWENLQREAIKNMLLKLSIMEVYITDFDYVTPPDYHAKESKTDVSSYSYMRLTLKEFLAILKQYMVRVK